MIATSEDSDAVSFTGNRTVGRRSTGGVYDAVYFIGPTVFSDVEDGLSAGLLGNDYGEVTQFVESRG